MPISTYKSAANCFNDTFILFLRERNCLLVHSITTLNFVFCMGFIAYFCWILPSCFFNPINKEFFVFSNRIRNKLFVNISWRNFPHLVLKQYFSNTLPHGNNSFLKYSSIAFSCSFSQSQRQKYTLCNCVLFSPIIIISTL